MRPLLRITAGIASVVVSACSGMSSSLTPVAPQRNLRPQMIPDGQITRNSLLATDTASERMHGKHVKLGSSGPLWLYVTNGGNSTITAYDEQGNQQTLSGSFPGLFYPVGLAYDPNNQLLYVGMANNGNYISAYDTNGNQQTLQQGAFPNLGDPYGIAYDPSNALLYVTNYQYSNANYGSITVYDESGNEQSLPGTFFGAYQTTTIAYDPNNGFLYNTNYGCCGQALVTVYDQLGVQQPTSGSFPGLTDPEGIIYNPSNGFIYVSDPNQQKILAFDENGNPQTLSGSWTGLNFPSGMAYDPDNGLIYVANSGGGLTGSTITAYDNNGNQQALSGSFPGLDYSDTIIVVPAPSASRTRKHDRAPNAHTRTIPTVPH